MLLIRNAQVMDPYTGLDEKREILIDDNGIIAALDTSVDAPQGCPVLDAMGKTICTGLVDTHVHFRDPGQKEKEDVASGMRAAAAGGFTTVVCMANTIPTCDNVETLRYVQQQAQNAGDFVHVKQACSITKGLKGAELTDFSALLAAGAPGFTDDGLNLTDMNLCLTAMERAVQEDTLLSFHEEDRSLVLSAGVNFGSAAAKELGVLGAKSAAEEAMVARDIALALRSGARVVFQHISSGLSIDLIRAGKALGAKIYCEVTPHHISLTEDAVCQYGTYARMNPPLRKEADRQALIRGLQDGTVDMIATDHAPHTAEEKARIFGQAPSGITGLETAFSVCNTYLVRTGALTKMQLLEKMSRNPAQIYRFADKSIAVGNRAELAMLDWDCEKIYKTYYSKGINTPYTNMPLVGSAICTIMGDQVVKIS